MKGYNVIMVFDMTETRVLMCRRKKPPYVGLSNLVGGKIEAGEDGYDAAYRELYEEAHISRKDVTLTHLMDFTYRLSDCYLEVYAGKLNKQVDVYGDEGDLFWADLYLNFFDMERFAGEGNIGHAIEQAKIYATELFNKRRDIKVVD